MSEPIYSIPGDIVFGPFYTLLADVPTDWGKAAMRVADLRAAGGDGAGEVVAVCDTGATVNHQEFAGRWQVAPRSFVGGESAVDGHGHGTHCLGSAAGVNPSIGVAFKAKLIANKCLSNQGSGTDSMIAGAVKQAFTDGATVISLSIGGGGYSAEMDALFKEIDDSGRCIILAASGNERGQGGETTYPGRYPTALAVAAVDSNGKYASFSNPGQTAQTLAIAAPGVNIVSAAPNGGYQNMSGTSMATPQAAGVVAAYQSARVKAGMGRLTGKQMRELFAQWAIDAGIPGADRDYGPGLISGAALARTLVVIPPVA